MLILVLLGFSVGDVVVMVMVVVRKRCSYYIFLVLMKES